MAQPLFWCISAINPTTPTFDITNFMNKLVFVSVALLAGAIFLATLEPAQPSLHQQYKNYLREFGKETPN